MPAATALIAGNDPLPQLAEQAARGTAVPAQRSGQCRTAFSLGSEFARHTTAAVTAAARAAQTTQTRRLPGLCTESSAGRRSAGRRGIWCWRGDLRSPPGPERHQTPRLSCWQHQPAGPVDA